MDFETDPDALALYSDEQWDALLDASWMVAGPRLLIVVPEKMVRPLRPWLPPDPDEVRSEPRLKGGLNDRRMHILAQLKLGRARKDIAIELGVSPSLITKILKGQRR